MEESKVRKKVDTSNMDITTSVHDIYDFSINDQEIDSFKDPNGQDTNFSLRKKILRPHSQSIHQFLTLTIKNCSFNVETNFDGFPNIKILSIDIKDSTFNKKVIFDIEIDKISIGGSNTFFKSDIEFNSKFNDYCIFNKVNFENNLRFNSTSVIDKKLEFSECNFGEKSFFTNLNFGNQISFIKCNLTNCSFINSNIEDVRFLNCSFGFDKFPYKDFITGRFTDIEFKEIKDIIASYREFEINFDKNKDYELAGKFHIERYKLQRKIETNWFNKLINFLYYLFSNYGESFIKPFVWIFASVLIIFPIIYFYGGINYINQKGEKEIVLIQHFKANNINDCMEYYQQSLKYTLNVSVPIKENGFKEVQSGSGFTTGVSIGQTIFIPILITLFIIALRRKFKR